jgi:peroxiredoxin/mono/diheme cytochrome c family protein
VLNTPWVTLTNVVGFKQLEMPRRVDRLIHSISGESAMSAGRRLLVLITLAIVCAPHTRGSEPNPIGFRLQDCRGAWHSLDDVRASKLVVVAFLQTECPLSGLYAPRLAELARAYEKRGVTFFGVDANTQDSLSGLARFAQRQELTFPLLKDVGNELADRLDAQRTPEVFVLDSMRVVRYRGRVDDQFGFGVHRPAPTRSDLAIALDELLAGKSVSIARTEPAGCKISRTKKPDPESPVTYSKHVARILRDRCVACHRDREIAPFSLATYKAAAGWAEMIDEVVRAGRMPPWHASPEYGKFSNDCRLSDQEKKTIAAWVAAGAPEGDPRELPEPAHYVEGWRIPAPDLVIPLPKTINIQAEGTMPYQNFTIDPKLKMDVWVRASQVRPGNPSVVHHLVVFVMPPGKSESNDGIDFLAAYAPGMPPRVLPDGTAKLIPAGSKLKFQVHYTPRGTPQTDRSEIGLVFADPKTIRKEITAIAAINMDLKIPPGAADYAATAEHRFDQDTLLYSLLPHMHLRGKAFRFEAIFAGGRSEVLLDVPRYEFEWQNVYVLVEPKLMPEGSVLRCLARYDNSAENFSNPDPMATVRWGEQTRDEMLVGYVEVARVDQDLCRGGPSTRKLDDGRYEVTFQYRAPAGTKMVYLAGTFNDWKPTAHKMNGPDDSGRFQSKLVLDQGAHEYKFVLEGTRWRQDPGNRLQVGFYHNSVVPLGRND